MATTHHGDVPAYAVVTTRQAEGRKIVTLGAEPQVFSCWSSDFLAGISHASSAAHRTPLMQNAIGRLRKARLAKSQYARRYQQKSGGTGTTIAEQKSLKFLEQHCQKEELGHWAMTQHTHSFL